MLNYNHIFIFIFIFSGLINEVLAKGELNIYNWSEYVAAEDLAQFEKEYDVKLNYSLYDSDYILESKLISGKTGYDLVFPSLSPFLARQIKLNLYQKLDKNKLKNYQNIDEKFLEIMARYDQNNEHAIPWIWSSLGVGYNLEKLKKIFPEGFPKNLNLVFEEKYLRKIAKCGVAILDSPGDIVPLILLHNHLDPNSKIQKSALIIEETLKRIKKFIEYFHTSKYIDDLANGEICVVLGYSTDIFQAASANEDEVIDYFIPEEGSIITIDTVSMLRDAKNLDNAYKFLDFILRPEVSARITNKYHYANTNKSSLGLINKKILNNKNIFLENKEFKKLHPKKELSNEDEKFMNRLWMRVISENS